MKRAVVPHWIVFAYAAFIVYGSLVPLVYRPMPLDQAWITFSRIPFLQLGLEARADWIANGVLYLPLGLLAVHALQRLGVFAFVIALPLCFGLAFAVEFTQLFFPARTVSQNDLIAECLGSLAGAALAPLLGPWLARLRATFASASGALSRHALQAYAAGYVLYCFFPFDLLLSAPEFAQKLQSDNWGWIVAAPEGRTTFRLVLQWLVELALSIPLGILLAGGKSGIGLRAAAVAGTVLGMFIEGGQFFIASAVSQGVSVLSRTIGVAAGVWLHRTLRVADPDAARDTMGHFGIVLLPPYALLLSAANGWWSHDWSGSPAAAWASTSLMPFYYHYFTTEAQALTSLGGVVVMYLPLAALAWARRASAAGAAWLAAAAALVIEAGKLFQPEAHADPTNLLIAAASAWLLLRLLALLTASDGAPASAAAAPSDAHARGHPGRRPWWPLPLLLAACAGALALPGAGPAVFAIVAACAALVWWRPLWALAVVPAAMPILDLAPITGRFFIDEFDFLLLACIGTLWLRLPPASPHRQRAGAGTMVWAGFGAAFAASTLIGLFPLQGVDANSLSSYYSHFNAIRIAKGALWAFAFMQAWRRLARRYPDAVTPTFGAGMAVGLGLTILAVVWERAVFVGLFDFAAAYRVTGPFSAMHKGGAYIECFLAVAAAYPMAMLVGARTRASALTGIVLLAAAAYAVAVTYSRNGYAAYAAVIAIGAVVATGAAIRHPRRLLGVGAALAVVAAIALPVLDGPYARQRLSHVREDLAVRAAHWIDALEMRDDTLLTSLFGMGVGRFPETHFWRSRESAHAAGFRLEREGDNQFLRLGPGAPIYIDQVVGAAAGDAVELVIDLRSAQAPAQVTAFVCRKWMLTSVDCRKIVLRGGAEPGIWHTVRAPFPSGTWGSGWFEPPLKFSIATPGGATAVDVDNARLAGADGRELLSNGTFSSALDRWFFATDIDPPWHIHNLAVAVLFDQGWAGGVAWLVLIVCAAAGGIRAARRGDSAALAAVAGLAAFLVSGSLNTLIDAPRFLWLFLVLAAICMRRGETVTALAAGPGSRSGRAAGKRSSG